MRGGRFVVVLAFACTFLGVCKPIADAVDPAPAAEAAAQATSSEPVLTVKPADSGFGVSVAFDGLYLYYTDLDGPVLHRIDPLNEADHVDTPIVGTDGVNAFTYDSTRGKFWAAGSDGSTIYLLDRSGIAVPVMNVLPVLLTHGFCDSDFGCQALVDGIAYDATTDTIWFTPDGSGRIYQFDVNDDPAQIVDASVLLRGFFDINDPGGNASGPTDPNAEDMAPQCMIDFSSGVGAGAQFLYLSNGDCQSTSPDANAWYFRYDKTIYNPPSPPCQDLVGGDAPLTARICPGNKLDWFPYNAPRAEDLECDDQTFHRTDRPHTFTGDVMWIRDAVDGAMRAYQIPTGTCIFGGGVAVTPTVGKFTGGGYLASPESSSFKVHTSFVLQCDPDAKPSRLQVTWGGNHFHMKTAMPGCSSATGPLGSSSSSFTNTGTGTGRYNGTPDATVDWTFTDNGEPGSQIATPDTGNITVKTATGTVVVHAEGPLVGGNYQAHP